MNGPDLKMPAPPPDPSAVLNAMAGVVTEGAKTMAGAATGMANTGAAVITSILEHPENVTEAVKTGVRDLLGTVQGKAAELLGALQSNLDGVLGSIEDHARSVLDKIKELYTTPPPLPPAPPPIDVVETLNQIALGIKRAEEVLNQQGLVVATGSVEAELTVRVPGNVAGAHAKLTLQIGPKPYA